jgi:hypothetical protein
MNNGKNQVNSSDPPSEKEKIGWSKRTEVNGTKVKGNPDAKLRLYRQYSCIEKVHIKAACGIFN